MRLLNCTEICFIFRTRKHTVTTIAASLVVLLSSLHAAEHLIQPGDSPQVVLDAPAPGDRVVFLPGLHQHGLGRHRSIFYVDKSVEIELREGATLKLAPDVSKLEAVGETTTDQDAGKKLDDLKIGGSFDVTRPAVDGPEVPARAGLVERGVRWVQIYSGSA